MTYRLGKLQKHAIEFATCYPGWHSFAKDGTTEKVIARLARRGIVKISGGNFVYRGTGKRQKPNI